MESLEGLQFPADLQSTILIEHPDNLSNIDALESVTRISGTLQIDHNALEDIEGLRNLEHIDGSLIIEGNASVSDFSPLDGLRSLNGSLNLSHFTNMTNLDYLSDLTSIDSFGGNLTIHNSYRLVDISALSGIRVLNGRIELGYWPVQSIFFPQDTFNLSDLSALSTIETIGQEGHLQLHILYHVENLQFLSGLRQIDGQVILCDLWNITDFDGLENLIHLNGAFIFSNFTKGI